MKKIVTVVVSALALAAAAFAQNQPVPSIQPGPAPGPAPGFQIADPPPAPRVNHSPSRTNSTPSKLQIKTPPIRLVGWTNWAGLEKTPAGNEVLVPYTKVGGKVKLIFQRDISKGQKAPPKGYYWRRPNAVWYVASTHELEQRAISQARIDQIDREKAAPRK